MNDFPRDGDGHWWFTTLGKGNKERQIAVSIDIELRERHASAKKKTIADEN